MSALGRKRTLSRSAFPDSTGHAVHESFSPAYRWQMSFKHVRTAADLVRFKCALRVECGRCHNATTMTGYEVAKVIGSQEFERLRRRLRCSLCGAREAELTLLDPPPPRH